MSEATTYTCCRCGGPLPGDEPCFERADGEPFHFICPHPDTPNSSLVNIRISES